jgi:hypothetical protein
MGEKCPNDFKESLLIIPATRCGAGGELHAFEGNGSAARRPFNRG